MKLIIDGFETIDQISRFIDWYSEGGHDELSDFVLNEGECDADGVCAEFEEYPVFDYDTPPKETKDSITIYLKKEVLDEN